jgi:T-complex protein 1 subunit eta
VDINQGVGNNRDAFVWEPLLVKVNALKAATEAACTILSIDETVRNPKSEQEEQQRRIKKSLPTAGRRK